MMETTGPQDAPAAPASAKKRRRKSRPPPWWARAVRRFFGNVIVQGTLVVGVCSLTAYLCARHGHCAADEPERLACVLCAVAEPLVRFWKSYSPGV